MVGGPQNQWFCLKPPTYHTDVISTGTNQIRSPSLCGSCHKFWSIEYASVQDQYYLKSDQICRSIVKASRSIRWVRDSKTTPSQQKGLRCFLKRTAELVVESLALWPKFKWRYWTLSWFTGKVFLMMQERYGNIWLNHLLPICVMFASAFESQVDFMHLVNKVSMSLPT